MLNVCLNCGEYRVDKLIESKDRKTFAICPECDHAHEFLQLPLIIVTGPSGAGKSTIVSQLSSLTKDFVVMETDILWDDRFNSPETNYLEYRELWLRMAKNISQSEKPVILCGTAMPEQLEQCIERRYFSELFYIALVCENNELKERLQNRPSWRGSNSDEFINGMIAYNNWLRENSGKNEPVINLIDTTNISPDETAQKIVTLISDKWI
ncbi:AAA family ATPase [Metabacillus dongyingensis]|uniref:AAA family ATPase n=1 Tax=Metabacillus dongyingensis TaxID=2874282 RepID=UPI003B8E8456